MVTKKGPESKRGFTLIELLIAMAILGILAAVGLGSFRSSQIKGRDAQRKSDLGQLQRALEMYVNDKAQYPTEDDFPEGGAEWRATEGTLYIKEVPRDPKDVNYCYEADSDGDWYRLYAKLENERDPAIEKTCGVGGADCTCDGDSDYNYKAESPNAP